MISLIAAIGKNNELGKNNTLVWDMPADMKYFRETTKGHTVIMGRKTFESIGHPMPNRQNIIITTDKNYKLLKSAATNGIDMSTPSGLEIIKNILYPGVKGETREPVPMWKIQNAVNDMAYESLHLLLALTINKFNVEQSPVNAGEYTQKALIKALG